MIYNVGIVDGVCSLVFIYLSSYKLYDANYSNDQTCFKFSYGCSPMVNPSPLPLLENMDLFGMSECGLMMLA